MKVRTLLLILALFVLASVLVSIPLFGSTLFMGNNSASLAGSQETTPGPGPMANTAIARENALPGTSSWQIPAGQQATTQIQAFAGATSVAPGQKLAFYVSTQSAQMHYQVDIYRIGWYGGDGARLLLSSSDNVGIEQGYYDANHNHLVCSSCTTDPQTGLLETHWKASYMLSVPQNWPSGVYLAKFTDAHGWQTYTPFDVLDNPSSAYVVVTPDTTAAAYNTWGGASLYEADEQVTGQGTEVTKGAGVAAVSFDRPYIQEDGSGLLLLFTIQTIRWLERQGYDLSYMSSVDLHEHPEQLLTHKAYISMGHDEYWTKEMRDGVEKARDAGVGLAFLAANTDYWQMRFTPDSAGTPDRTIVCYKVQTSNNDLSRDPLYGNDNSRVTAQWRDPVIGRPENALTGVMFSDLTHKFLGFPWTATEQTDSALLKGTGIQAGKSYGCGLVGYEWDRAFTNPNDDPTYRDATPKGLHLFSSSRVTASDDGKTDGISELSQSAYYIAPSGALVFASGSLYWGSALDDYRSTSLQDDYVVKLKKTCGDTVTAVPELQKLMGNVMQALLIKHGGNE